MGFNYKFKFNEPEFVITDKEITCKLTLVDGPIDIPYINHISWFQEGIANRWNPLNKKYIELLKKTYIGVARKYFRDTDNVEMAKEVAYKKARRQFLKEINNFYTELLGQMYYVFNGIDASRERNLKELDEIKNRILYLTDRYYDDEWDFPTLSRDGNSIGLTKNGRWFIIIPTQNKNDFNVVFNDGDYMRAMNNGRGLDCNWINLRTGEIINQMTNKVMDKIIYIESNKKQSTYELAGQTFRGTLKNKIIKPNQWFRYKTLERYDCYCSCF